MIPTAANCERTPAINPYVTEFGENPYVAAASTATTVPGIIFCETPWKACCNSVTMQHEHHSTIIENAKCDVILITASEIKIKNNKDVLIIRYSPKDIDEKMFSRVSSFESSSLVSSIYANIFNVLKENDDIFSLLKLSRYK